jgi:hypothetical protein
MKRQRELPLFAIEGTDFVVDVGKHEFREKDHPANRISFFDDISDAGDHYFLLYDRSTKNYPRGGIDPSVIVEVPIPQMAELDPEGMAAKYGLTVDQVKGKTDFEIIVDQELLAERLAGRLPRIGIAGEQYIIDLHLKELRPEDGFGPAMHLLKLELSPDEDRYTCYFDPVFRQVVQVDPEITELPKGLVLLEIPFMSKLDPVGMAEAYGMEPRDVLKRYPIQKELMAKVTPAAESPLAALVQRNRQRESEREKKRRQQRRRLRPRL